ncbi:MAG: vWA domain-containing protein [Planctomycetota bacterium]
MKFARLLAVLALSCWVAAVWPRALMGGDTWVLLDRSASMGAEPPLEDWLAANELDLATWRKAVRKQRVLSFPHPDGFPTSDLAEALRQMRPKLSAGDHLILRTDGRALTALPDSSAWEGIRITAIPPAPQPRFHQVIAPTAWPQQAPGMWIRIRLQDADLPHGNLEVQDASHQVQGLALQNQGDGWLALQLRCEQTPTETIPLRLRWTEEAGQATYALNLAPPSGGSLQWVSEQTSAREMQQALEQGAILVLADTGVQRFQDLPSELAVFRAQEVEEERPLWVLLDVSGSMEGVALEDAKQALRSLIQGWPQGPIQVVPFQQGILPTRTLRRPEDLQLLEDLVAFGPTDLAASLQALAPKLAGPQALLILSDGAAEQADLDWSQLLQQHLPQTRVFCLPTGPKAEWDFLRGLGEVLEQGSVQQRLDQVLQRLQEAPTSPVFPNPASHFPLPDRWNPQSAHPAWELAPGAELLLQDAQDRAYLGVRRVGPGLLIGVADSPHQALEALLAGLEQAFRSPSRDGWVGRRFFVSTAQQPPVIRQEGQLLELRMHDVGPPVRWEALEPSPLAAVQVEMPQGQQWQAGALTAAEWGTSPKPWDAWLEILRNGLTGSVFRPRLLWAGVILLTAAFVLRTLPSR